MYTFKCGTKKKVTWMYIRWYTRALIHINIITRMALSVFREQWRTGGRCGVRVGRSGAEILRNVRDVVFEKFPRSCLPDPFRFDSEEFVTRGLLRCPTWHACNFTYFPNFLVRIFSYTWDDIFFYFIFWKFVRRALL